MDGVDDETWLYHLRGGDISAWFRKNIKNEELADAAASIERDNRATNAGQSRAKFRKLLEARYTIPA